MSRSLQFDREDVLGKALNLFWSDGYEASSISKLLNVMGLNRGSLYASFKDKNSLFKAVIKHYFDYLYVNLFTPTLIEIDDPVKSIRAFFYQGILYQEASVRSCGCLLFNVVSELNSTRPELVSEANHWLQQTRGFILQRLLEAKSVGMIEPNKNVDLQADFLMCVLAGLRTQCKMKTHTDDLKKIIDIALHTVFGEN